jgi:DNA-binding MarR family transcriptional regulator
MSRRPKNAAARAALRVERDYADHPEIHRLLPFYDTGGQSYFGYRVVLAAKLFDRKIAAILSRSGTLTLPQWRVLSQLGLSATGTVRSLANGAAVDPAEVSRATRDLVRLGLLNRRDNSADKRSPLFELTPAGRKSFAAIRKPISKFIQDLVQDLDDEDLAAADRVLWAVTQGCLR